MLLIIIILVFLHPYCHIRKWNKRETGCVVVVPTRELAVQIADVFGEFLPSTLSLLLLIGGTEVASDISKINEDG